MPALDYVNSSPSSVDLVQQTFPTGNSEEGEKQREQKIRLYGVYGHFRKHKHGKGWKNY